MIGIVWICLSLGYVYLDLYLYLYLYLSCRQIKASSCRRNTAHRALGVSCFRLATYDEYSLAHFPPPFLPLPLTHPSPLPTSSFQSSPSQMPTLLLYLRRWQPTRSSNHNTLADNAADAGTLSSRRAVLGSEALASSAPQCVHSLSPLRQVYPDSSLDSSSYTTLLPPNTQVERAA